MQFSILGPTKDNFGDLYKTLKEPQQHLQKKIKQQNNFFHNFSQN